MYQLTSVTPIDYLVIGHITVDLTPQGLRLGGTATYSALMAHALGLRVGIVTSWGGEIPLGPLDGATVVNLPSEKSTTFENRVISGKRIQVINHVAHPLGLNIIPEDWMATPIVHLGPVAQEVDPGLVRHFSNSFVGLTPQGWLRTWDQDGRVFPAEWPESAFVMENAGATVISREDVGGDEARIEELASSCRVLAVTENADGVRLYWHGDVRRFRPVEVDEVDPIGAGDIFAAALFFRLFSTRDPWEAARFATHLSAISVTRPGLDGIPNSDEIHETMVEVF
ncbi:MAG TPA: PfkB family carbohydrate kinase [Anaerolineales bacterium]|nr:PfkB family carbohydrate kinase [Anaerolineales bacterium]